MHVYRNIPRWPMTAQVIRRASRLASVMARLGVDRGAAARADRGVAFARARRTCLTCQNAGDCDRWLADPNRSSMPSFCPNAPFFDSVRTALERENDHA